MLNRIKTFLSSGGFIEKTPQGSHHTHKEHQLAAAALLIEAARLDEDHSSMETATIHRILGAKFDLSEMETTSLFEAASDTQEKSVDIHQFTRQIKQTFSEEERIHLIEMLWEVAYADGVLHDYEANLLRRVGGLIHVSDKDRGDARRRVLEKLGIEVK